MSKEVLRKKLIKLRKKNFIEHDISFIELKKILKKSILKKKIIIGGYYPINSEINCLNILKKFEKNNFKISLPVTKKNNNMEFYIWSFQEPLKVSKQGIPVPNPKKKVNPDVLIIPIVGFDRNKFRLGYGGGYYDRYISKILSVKKTLTVGFAFSFQEVLKIPINKYDQKLDLIFTNRGIIK